MLEQKNYQLELDKEQLKSEIAVLCQKNMDQIELLDHKTQLYMTSESKNQILTQNLSEKQAYIDQNLAVKLKECIHEINKGNRIIKQFTADLNHLKSKLKLKSSVIIKQEEEIKNLKQKNLTLSNANDTLHQQISNLKVKDENLSTILEKSKEQIEKYHDNISQNKKLIHYLQHELNKSKLKQFSAGAAGNATGSSSSSLLFFTPLKQQQQEKYIQGYVHHIKHHRKLLKNQKMLLNVYNNLNMIHQQLI